MKKNRKSKGYDSEQDTLAHKGNVEKSMQEIVNALLLRAMHHDNSKLGEEEKPLWDKYSRPLKDIKFNSTSYAESLERLDAVIQAHYKKNRHHPEHWKNGIEDMNLIDMLEMLADWKAASIRTHGGSFKHSFDVCAFRFKLSCRQKQMLRDTAIELGWLD